MTAQTFTTTTVSRRRRMVAVAASAALPLVGLWALAVPAGAQQDPAGNNGTIKVDGEAFDNGHPNNEPHVDCNFEIDFYGFDKGDYFAQVTFNAHPPTGNGEELLTDKVFIGEDDNSGGGSQAGFDAHKEYDLTSALAAFTPQLEQGWHVKLTINAQESHGNDVKHKVFWVKGCQKPETPTDTPDTPNDNPDTPKDNPEPPGNPDVEAQWAGDDPLAPGQPAPQPETKTDSKTEVKGAVLTRTDSELPRTGLETLPLAGLGLALLGTGQAARIATRRRVR